MLGSRYLSMLSSTGHRSLPCFVKLVGRIDGDAVEWRSLRKSARRHNVHVSHVRDMDGYLASPWDSSVGARVLLACKLIDLHGPHRHIVVTPIWVPVPRTRPEPRRIRLSLWPEAIEGSGFEASALMLRAIGHCNHFLYFLSPPTDFSFFHLCFLFSTFFPHHCAYHKLSGQT